MSNQQTLDSKEPRQILSMRIADIALFIKKYILWFIAVGVMAGIIGYLYSYTLQETFKAKTVLLPEYSMGSNSFMSFAMGANTAEGAEKLSPDLYPTILEGIPFGIYLLKQPVSDINNVSYPNLDNFLQKEKNSQSAQTATGSTATGIKISNKDILALSKEEEQKINGTVNLVRAVVDKKNGIITLESEMTDPVVSAILVEAGKKYLMDYVEEYRSAKLTQQSSFLEERVKEAKQRQQSAEYALQSYRDRNRNAYLNVARIEEQRLQSDYTLAQSLYADLVSRLEQIKLKVKQEKPVFKVLEPTKIPLTTSGPRRVIIAVIFSFAAVFILFIYIFFFREKYHLNFWDLIIVDRVN
jgi:uncharacterized protein involved in exopolysaccharide biosynthesis